MHYECRLSAKSTEKTNTKKPYEDMYHCWCQILYLPKHGSLLEIFGGIAENLEESGNLLGDPKSPNHNKTRTGKLDAST